MKSNIIQNLSSCYIHVAYMGSAFDQGRYLKCDLFVCHYTRIAPKTRNMNTFKLHAQMMLLCFAFSF